MQRHSESRAGHPEGTTTDKKDYSTNTGLDYSTNTGLGQPRSTSPQRQPEPGRTVGICVVKRSSGGKSLYACMHHRRDPNAHTYVVMHTNMAMLRGNGGCNMSSEHAVEHFIFLAAMRSASKVVPQA